MKILIFQTVYETLRIFLIAFVLFTVVLTIVFTIHYARKEGIPVTHITLLVPYLMVEVTRISIPATLLMATTTCFARMSGNNEIIALKSLGIPPWQILWPIMILGIAASLVSASRAVAS